MQLRERVVGLWSHFRRCPEWVWAPLVYSGLVASLYHGIFSGTKGFGWDTTETYGPDLEFLARQLAQLQWPSWNPYDHGGYPVAADPQPAMFYPVQWLFAGSGALFGAGWWLIQIKMLTHHVIAGLTLHAWLRSRRIPPIAALVGGVALLCTVGWVRHKSSNLLQPMVWAPLVWLAIDALTTKPTWRRAIAAAAAVYLVASAGSPPGMFYTALLVIPYGAFRVVEALVRYPQQRVKLGLATAGAVALAGILVVGIILPGLELGSFSPRTGIGANAALSAGLVNKLALPGLLSPAVGDNQAYCGIIIMALLACAVVLRPRRDAGVSVLLFVMAAVFVAMSLGTGTPVLPWFVKHIPGFDIFRIANRYRLLSCVAIAALGGFGAAAMLECSAQELRRKLIFVVVAAVVAGAAIALTLWLDSKPQGLRTKKEALYLAATATVLLCGGIWYRKLAIAAVALVAVHSTVDAALYIKARRTFYMQRQVHGDEAEVLDKLADVRTRWRIHDEFVLEQRVGSRLLVRDFRGYPSGDPLDSRKYRAVLKYAEKYPQILEAYNVRYLLHAPHHRAGRASQHVKDPRARGHARQIDRQVFEFQHPAPIVAWYGQIRVEQGHGRILTGLREGEDAAGVRRYAVVDPASAKLLGGRLPVATPDPPFGPPSVPGELLQYGSDRIVVRIDAPDRGLVVLNEVMYPGWTVEVDGHTATPIEANLMLRAVEVEPGLHTITWTFHLRNGMLYSLLWWLGIFIMMGAAIGPWAWRVIAARRARRAAG